MAEISPYQRGHNAATRLGEYEGAEDTPDCPYEEGCIDYEDWWDGFGDGTEDFIQWQRGDDLP